MKCNLGLALIIAFLILVSGCNEASQEGSQENADISDSESDGRSSQDNSDLINNISNQTFNWNMAEGTKIKVMLNNHHYADAIVAELADFEALTGIKVEFSLTEENFFFDKVTNALSNEDNDMDVFMSGAYQLWNYDDLGYVENLMPYIENESITGGDYDFKDFFPELIEVLMSDKEPDALLAIPIGFELYNLAYNQRIFEEMGLEVPETFEEMLELAGNLRHIHTWSR